MITDWREIGPTSNALVALRSLNVPEPDRIVPHPCNEAQQRGDGTWDRVGWAWQEWVWFNLSAVQAESLLTHIFTDDDDASATAYIYTSPLDGYVAGATGWRTYQTVVKRPDLSGEDGAPLDGAPDAGYEDFKLHFTILADVTP